MTADREFHADVFQKTAAADSTGTAGDTAYDSSYFYICTATNTWRRIAHDTWT